MRNGNNEEDLAKLEEVSSYRTYEEWKLALPGRVFE